MSGFCGYGDSVGIFTGFSVGIGWVKRKLLNTVKTRILWSHHEETWELPGERDNARNSARRRGRRRTAWMDNIKTWTELPVEESRTEINGESTFMVWPTLGSRTAKEQIGRV